MSEHRVMSDGTPVASYAEHAAADRLVADRMVQHLGGRLWAVGVLQQTHVLTEDGRHSACSCEVPQPCRHALAVRELRNQRTERQDRRDRRERIEAARADRQGRRARAARRVCRMIDALEATAAVVAMACLLGLVVAEGRTVAFLFAGALGAMAAVGCLESLHARVRRAG